MLDSHKPVVVSGDTGIYVGPFFEFDVATIKTNVRISNSFDLRKAFYLAGADVSDFAVMSIEFPKTELESTTTIKALIIKKGAIFHGKN